MFKFAARNILSKPLRAVFTILAIALAVAMIFSMLSIKDAIYEYMFETETASSGNSDITISTNSSSDRITSIPTSLSSLDNIECVTPSLSLYALYKDEYVSVRGFQENSIDIIQNIELISGSTESLKNGINIDNAVISKDCADYYNLKIGSSLTLELGTQKTYLIVGAIAENNGYFLNDSPFQIISSIKAVSKLISSQEAEYCNTIYIKVKDTSKINETIQSIKLIPEYSNLLVKESKDISYIEAQVKGLTAPVVLTGAAVLLLAVAIVFVLFLSTESEKVDYASRMKIVGATKKQIVLIFLIETVMISLVGIVVGAGLGIGIFVGLAKIVLSKSLMVTISAGLIFAAMGIAFVVSVLSSLLPIFKSFKSTIRENIVDKKPQSKFGILFIVLLSTLVVISVVLESTISTLTSVLSIVSAILTLCLVLFGVPYVSKILAYGLKKSSVPEIKFSAISILRQKRFSRSVMMLTMGMLIAMMLFMTWSLTTSLFTRYTTDFKDMIFITNIQSSVDVEQFKSVDGVNDSCKLVWKEGKANSDKFSQSMNLFGSKDILSMIDFDYVTDKAQCLTILSDNSKPYVLTDVSLKELYGIEIGDVIEFTIEEKKSSVIVGGFVEQQLLSGRYFIMNSENVYSTFGFKEDTVLILSNDVDKAVENLRLEYSNKNYFVIKALEAYQWEMDSLNAVFDLIGALAFIIAILTFIIIVATTIISRGVVNKEINSYLNAGMSKMSMLKKELYEHTQIAFVSCVVSYLFSILLTYCMIHALRLFGFYFAFMYSALPIALTGIVMGVLYILLPVALNFKKSYNISKLRV